MSKKKQHHSKPHGGSVSYAQRLAQQRMLRQALTDEVAMQQADLWAKQSTVRGLWLMVCAVADAFHVGPMRMRRDLFPAIQANQAELERMKQENGEVYAFEKLRQRAEQVCGESLEWFYEQPPEDALREEAEHEKEQGQKDS